MSTKDIFMFIGGVLLSLFLLTFVSSANTIYNEQYDTYEDVMGIKIGEYVFKYPTVKSLTDKGVNIKNDKAEKVLDLVEKKQKTTESKKDTLTSDDQLQMQRKLISNTEGHFYYPGDPEEFLKKLDEKLRQKNCRIVHYGDSKTEGDRMTSRLRDELQALYGGGGPGYFPIVSPYPQKSIVIKTTGQWDRYSFFNLQHRRQGHLLPTNQYGLWANACRFTPAKGADSAVEKEASIVISPSKKSYYRLGRYKKMGIHYGNCLKNTKIQVYADDLLITNDSLIADGKYHCYSLKFDKTPQEIKINLKGTVSPDFYGITLEDSGVTMDNVPTRGDAGVYFTSLGSTFDVMSKILKPDVFVFEFGGNMIPILRSPSNAKYNARRLIDNINWVRKRNPDALFILIGPSDMLKRSTMQSYPMIPAMLKEMKSQALDNNVAFWSIYEGMGGANSMKVWREKGYGGADLIHFTDKGTRKVEELMWTALQDNLLYIREKKEKITKKKQQIIDDQKIEKILKKTAK